MTIKVYRNSNEALYTVNLLEFDITLSDVSDNKLVAYNIAVKLITQIRKIRDTFVEIHEALGINQAPICENIGALVNLYISTKLKD